MCPQEREITEEEVLALTHSHRFNERLRLPDDFNHWLDGLTDRIVELDGCRRTVDTIEGTRRCLGVVIGNLLNGSSISRGRWVSINQNRNHYVRNRYKNHLVTYAPLRRVLSILISAAVGEAIEIHQGFFDRQRSIGRVARFRLTQPFYHSFFPSDQYPHAFPLAFEPPPIITNTTWGFPPNLLHLDPHGESIRLKDPDKRLIDYRDDDETQLMREELAIWNEFASQHWADLFIPDETLENLQFQEDDEGEVQAQRFDWNRRHLYRVFNNGSFDQGGRFYGGWWQSIPSEYRRFITIDGQRTVEIDYSTMQASMLYARVGQQLPVDEGYDAYALEGLDRDGYRHDVKRAFMKLINSREDQQLSPRGIGPLPDGWSFDRLIDGLMEKHAQIAEFFRTGVGLNVSVRRHRSAAHRECSIVSALDSGHYGAVDGKAPAAAV